MACRIMMCSCSLCPYCGTSKCPEFNKHIERYWVYVTDKKRWYLIPKVQVNNLESLRGGIRKIIHKKKWASKYVRNNKVEITITDGECNWRTSIRIYLNIEDGALYTKDNEVWDWKLKFVER